MHNLGFNILCYVRDNKRLFNLKNNNKKCNFNWLIDLIIKSENMIKLKVYFLFDIILYIIIMINVLIYSL